MWTSCFRSMVSLLVGDGAITGIRFPGRIVSMVHNLIYSQLWDVRCLKPLTKGWKHEPKFQFKFKKKNTRCRRRRRTGDAAKMKKQSRYGCQANQLRVFLWC